MKTEFMQYWDGLLPMEATHHILVLGATNRPYDLDAAVMRRFSLQLEVRSPRRTVSLGHSPSTPVTDPAMPCEWGAVAGVQPWKQ